MFSVSNLLSQNSNEILGVWYLESSESKIEIFKCGDNYCGKIMEAPSVFENDGKTFKKDKNNPNEKLRSRTVVGIINLTNLDFKDEKYTNGLIYDASRGKVWDCVAEVKGNELHFTGYVGFEWLGKTVIWKRVE